MSRELTAVSRYSLRYAYDSNYDGHQPILRVVEWGPGTSGHLVDLEEGVLAVEGWEVLWVDAYVRGYKLGDAGWGDSPWATFPVLQWSEIPNVFESFFATGGLYTRVSFHVEKWIWTRECGWECDDQA